MAPRGKTICHICARSARIVLLGMAKARKNLTFALKRPEKCSSRRQKRAKTSLLRSKGRKSALGKPKSAQKPHFCAQKAGKVLSGSPQARKNTTFALGRSRKCCWEDLPRTKSLFLSLKYPKTWQKLTKKGQNGHFCPQKPLKWRFGRQKKDKNLTFVLGKTEITVPAIHRAHP